MKDVNYLAEFTDSDISIKEVPARFYFCDEPGEWTRDGQHVSDTYDEAWMELFELIEKRRTLMSDALIRLMPSTKTQPSE